MTSPPSTTSKTPLHAGIKWLMVAIAVGVAGGGLALLWGNLAQATEDRARLAAENERLQEALSEAQSALDDPRRTPWQRAIPAGAGAEETPEPETRVEAPAATANQLVLEEATVTATAEGALVARMRFQPTTSNDLDVFALVVRLPRGGASKILGLQPVGETAFSDAVHRVAENGLFAIYQARPTGVGSMEFDLTVSEPGTATVRGTLGLAPFDLDIQPDAASVTKI